MNIEEVLNGEEPTRATFDHYCEGIKADISKDRFVCFFFLVAISGYSYLLYSVIDKIEWHDIVFLFLFIAICVSYFIKWRKTKRLLPSCWPDVDQEHFANYRASLRKKMKSHLAKGYAAGMMLECGNQIFKIPANEEETVCTQHESYAKKLDALKTKIEHLV